MTGQIFILLYPNFDDDLLDLYETVGKKDFIKITKDALKVLTRPGYIPKVPLPPQTVKHNPELDKPVRILSTISSKNDEDIRQLIDHIKKNQHSAFVKMALRVYLGPIKYFNSKLDIDLIRTNPIYTPSGVIVFPGSTSPVISFKSRQTVEKLNKRIVERTTPRVEVIQEEVPPNLPKVYPEPETPAPVEQVEVKQPTAVEQKVPNTAAAAGLPISSSFSEPAPQPAVSQLPISNSFNEAPVQQNNEFKASEFGFEETQSNNDEDDILSLLEGLM